MTFKTITIFCTFAETVMTIRLLDRHEIQRRPCNDGACKNYGCPLNENGHLIDRRERRRQADQLAERQQREAIDLQRAKEAAAIEPAKPTKIQAERAPEKEPEPEPKQAPSRTPGRSM